MPQPLARYNSFCGPMAEHPWGLGATPTGPSHRHLFYGEQTHFGLNFLQLLSLRQTHLLQVLGSRRLSLLPSPNHACWQQFPGIHSFHTAVETLRAESGGQELSHNTAGPNEPSVLPMQVLVTHAHPLGYLLHTSFLQPASMTTHVLTSTGAGMLNRLPLHKESNRKRSLGGMEQGHRAGILCSPAGLAWWVGSGILPFLPWAPHRQKQNSEALWGMHESRDSIS